MQKKLLPESSQNDSRRGRYETLRQQPLRTKICVIHRSQTSGKIRPSPHQNSMLDFDFKIQYKKGINMPADFLSRQTVDHLSGIDPFGPNLPELQAANSDIIRLKHFSENASWPQGTPKSIANRLVPLVSKIFSQDNTLWIRLVDS